MALQENSTLSGHTLGFHPQAQSLDHLLHCSKQYHRPGGGGGTPINLGKVGASMVLNPSPF